MDSYEATKIVYSRIQSLDPENAAKIMGLLLMQDHGEKEMIRLAFGPESHLHSVVSNAHKDLGVLPTSSPSSPAAGSNAFIFSRKNSLSPSSPLPPANEQLTGENDLLDELFLHDQFSFLNDSLVGQRFAGGGELFYPEANGGSRSRNSPVSDLFHGGGDAGGLGWKPCLYFARGYCKNGTSCRFLHGFSDDTVAAIAGKLDAMVEQQLLLRSKSQRLMASAATCFPFSPPNSFPPSPSSSCTSPNFLPHNLFRRPWMERSEFAGMANPGSRQIYLTFPADSTFREEDVSNYFSIYGPVQDVRIPYQQKRMFGFVTFVYPETVKLILAKGNPHFVCDARVLVKPYKEKGKVPEKYRKQQLQGEGGEFSSCTTPAGLDCRDPYYLQPLGARILHGSCNQDALLSRKMEEQQELQKAIELQQGRFVGLQLLDLRRRNPTPSTTTASAATEGTTQTADNGAATAFSRAEKKETSTKDDDNLHESGPEHNLPDSPFASPTKSAIAGDYSFAASSPSTPSAFLASTLPPVTSPQEIMASFKSCFFQAPRISGSGAIGL